MQHPFERPYRDNPRGAARAGHVKAAKRSQRGSDKGKGEVRHVGRGETPPERVASVCARFATRQHGVVAHEQLLNAGVDRGAIQRLFRAGGLHRLHRGVYAVGHLALVPYANEQAALLACGAGSVISHRSAAYLWGLLEAHPRDVEVTMVARHCRPKPHVRTHRVATLDEGDVRLKHGLRVTSPARTVIDMAAEGSDRELEAVIAEARIRGLLRDGELERALDAAGFRKGTGRLRALLRVEGEPGLTRSDGERRLRRLLRVAGLEQPRSNVKIAGWEVDFLWPEQRVVVEFDSYAFHGHRAAFERDRRKDMALRDAGYTVIRITGRQLRDQPFALIAHIARALERAARAAREAG